MSSSILIIEDNTDIRENIAEILELAGCKVSTAENGKKGVEMALKAPPHLIICDIMMPELDGYGVLHLLRKNKSTQTIPFIFLTAKTERSDLRKGMELGADDYITKPFEDSEVLSAVEVRLKKAQLAAQTHADSPEAVQEFLQAAKKLSSVEEWKTKYDTEVYSKKTVLYHEGKRPRFLFYLLSGKVKVAKVHADGKEYISDWLSAGDFAGYTSLLEDQLYSDTATVLEDAEVIQIPKDDFLQMIHGDAALASKFIQLISRNVKEKEERLMNLAYSSLRKRVAKGLVDVADKFDLHNGAKAIQVSREELAQYVGTATESLIRTLSDFKQEGLIEVNGGKIHVIKPDALRNLLW